MAPTLAVGGLLLLAWGSGRLPLGDHGNGMGGPAEPPMSRVLATEAGFSHLLPGALVRRDENPVLPLGELGPVFRPDEGPREMVIGRRETFYDALVARGVAHEDIMILVKACKPFRNLSKVRAGERFRIHVAPDGGLRSLGFDLDEESHVSWVRRGDTYEREDGTYPVERRLRGVGGTIELSLYASLQQLDAPLALAAKLNDILGWDVDFSRDLRRGDTFRVVYEEIWKEGRFVRTGPVMAAELTCRDAPRRAYLYTDRDGKPGYYDPDGKNLQKQLMRAPLEYSRVSSEFSYRRFHPVLKRHMPHLGVDYAAPLGTPVRAAGDGTVVAARRKEGNGRYVQIRHTNREYETFYLHLSGFAKGVKEGTKVRQGQLIGYVGATGYATGPHLDFRVRKSGQFVNPRTLKLPPADPVPAGELPVFAALGSQYAVALDAVAIGTTVPVPAVAVIQPPAWDGQAYAAEHAPLLTLSAAD
ncbi:MAG: peptidoglycan DD-metalloendopeptidase family protein [Candidatus Krumholzibacteriia bacterium]